MPTRFRAARTVAVLAAAAGLLAACGQPADTPAQSSGSAAEPGLAHVHGLGVDPADGMLYAASHHGVFRIPVTGSPQRVGPGQDTMGFTIVGPRHFLGSGHPESRSDGPANLGLIESVDAGQTWQGLSLAGSADFHALEAKQGLVYGYDSQSRRLMVSTDNQNWDLRARVALVDFAVDPANPDVVVANTQQGIARSTDGARTFTIIPDAPELVFLEWPTADTLIASDPNNTIYVSTDGGTTWSRQGQGPGAPEAFAATGPSEIYLATVSGIHYSNDGGRTFTLRQALSLN